ncbi:TlpA disulfide reductase family protein [Paenibacillus filicis]|uniref:TlpA disulfide reductase family protein n=1 Tax=Paenibacillus gyeongsangnamensis TaxID=3388067 RepID=A0ABT4Q9Z5_9BACL|nr:TlpA disulfide reductase family protein [Paenibacillus filicis]MCZ8513698.1 TlpA disulfide reductase family protein [Paenibacillus filicis]
MKKNAIALIALIALIIWGVYDYQSKKEPSAYGNQIQETANLQEGISLGNKAPDFELQSLEGKKVKLSDYRGKKILVNFWATWCPPCRVEMPEIEKFYEEFKSKDVVVLAINLTQTEKSADDVPKFVHDYGLTFPVALDEKGNVIENYKVVAYPTSYIIDSQGIIQDKYQGAINYDIMKKSFSKIK